MADDSVIPGPAFPDATASDLWIIEQLREHGANLSKPRQVTAYVYFQAQPHAERAIAELASAGFRGSLGSNETQDSWLATVEVEMVVSAEAIADLSRALEAVAARHNGDYDGWEASAAP